MTLVGLDESNINIYDAKQHLISMMLSVQAPQQQQHYHHARTSPQLTTLHQAATVHRGNVIVTAPNNNNNTENKLSAMQQTQTQQQSTAQQKKKMYSQTTPYGSSHQPASVARRNARERNRVKQVNNGFATLRQHIPQSLAQALGNNTAGTHGGARAGSKKLSKVETLRMAVEYIRNLQQLLEENETEVTGSTSGSSAGSPSPKSNQSLEQEHHYQPKEIKFELKCESGDDEHIQDYVSHHHHYQHLHQQHQPQSHNAIYIPAPCSEASSSPTPSLVSEASSAGGSQGYGTSFPNTIYTTYQDYEGHEPMSPEDEEILDYISLWQQGQ